ncbi:hypothetical protein K457DRAFT_158132 [Linnemannia elongata AG-77]|uniref:Uncharacterized protein n=1 Tax=Linnemannia elongata AG-77 TaxID=1314771 RepID=A0A197JM65_9FUNG|nr:hypothetical protein K457DRAFT_158132 [Linnemannia elongata AG-77]
MVSTFLTSAEQKGAWTKALVLFVITALSLSIPTATSEPATYASNITDFGASNRIAPLVMNVKQSFGALKDTKRTTSIRANVGISRTTDAGGSSLGVCYHGVDDKPSGCAQIESGSTGCLVAGKTATVTHRVAKGFVNRQIEIHANRNALCIDFVGFSYGGGDMHPARSRLAVTGDMTFECGHPWAYSGQDTNGFQHKCLFIGNVETMDYVNTYSFAVEELWLSAEALRQNEDLSSVPNTVRYSCKSIGSWSRKDMPQTNPECDQYDSNFDDGKDAPRKKKYISEEVHKANLLVNPNYAGKPVVNGTVEIETDYA